jgi:hypothetical protein
VLDEAVCANPSCACREVTLGFVRLNDAGRDDGFTVTFHLDGDEAQITGLHGQVSHSQAESAFAAYCAARRGLGARLHRHYDEVKDVGRRSLAATVAAKFARKPARNGPCPCGSGKRYKACCAAR